jgi:hypothetical protein
MFFPNGGTDMADSSTRRQVESDRSRTVDLKPLAILLACALALTIVAYLPGARAPPSADVDALGRCAFYGP